MTTWLLYKFTITAKMGFMYHIPGPDEDPDDPKTNTCPLDPVLENKLNMLAALPKQVFGMLVPKELPDVRALMPYSLRLPHARDALDCKFDMVGPVSVSQGQLDEVKAFHAAMMEGPQKKKDPKKVAEELKKLTAAARKALGDDLPQLEPEPESASEPAGPAAAPQTPTQEQGSIEPASAPATAIAQQHSSEDQASAAAAASQPVPMEQDQPAVTTANAPLASQRVADSAAAPAQQADKTPLLLQQSVVPQPGKTDDSLGKGKLAAVTTAAASSQLGSGESHDAAKADDPAAASTADPEPARFDELTKFTEGQEDAENKFVSNYYMLPLKQWMDWEDPDDVMDDSSAEIDWEAVKHVKYGWKPLSTLQEASDPQQEPMDVMQPAGEQTTRSASADAQLTSCTARHTMCEGKAETTVVQADQPVPNQGQAESTLLDRDQANPDTGTSAFSIQEGAQAVPSNYKPLREEQTAPSKISKGLAAAAATTLAGDLVAPSNSHKGSQLGQLDYWRLTNSVVVTTYNSTPYFFEDIDPVLTPESKFPEEKLKLQVVFEEEEEDEFLKPKPPKETHAPTDKPGQSSDKAKEAESAPAVATPAVSQEQDDMVTKLTASRKAATFTQYFKYVHMHIYA